MRTVYIETTVPSYYHETRSSPECIAWRTATRNWWDSCRHRFALKTSRFVLAELRRSPASKRLATLELMSGIELLDEPPELSDVAEYYIEHRAMPAEAAGDAYHLALASLHGIEFLLTWNCRHLANSNKQRQLTVLNARLGLPMPTITTPLMLLLE